jgi:hypothetical protein
MKRPRRGRPYAPRIVTYVTKVEIMVNVVNISGGNFGALNIGGVQTIQSIDMKIGQLLAQPDARDLAEALRQLTEAVIAEPAGTPGLTQEELLEQIEGLGEQATRPPENRKRGIVKATFESVAAACNAVNGLAGVWRICGPTIRGFFGL